MTLALTGGEWSDLPPGTHWIGGWVGPRTNLEERESLPLPVLELRPPSFPTRILRYAGSQVENCDYGKYASS
jgi:hypothetical protein